VVEAITAYRIAHVLYSEQVPIVPRIIAEYAHGLTVSIFIRARGSVKDFSSITVRVW